MTGKLIIVRHGESEWNATGQWTGITDVGLTQKGKADAALMGHKLKDMTFHHGIASDLKRTLHTMEEVLKVQGQTDLQRTQHKEVTERDYGEYTGLNKWEVKEKVGQEIFDAIRRNWEEPIPGGETLKDVHARAVPFFLAEVVPRLHKGQNVLYSGHGNTIRALIKHIEDIPEKDISKVEMVFGTVLIYDLDKNGKMLNKEIRQIDSELPNA